MGEKIVLNGPLGLMFRFMEKELILKGVLFTLLGILIFSRPAATLNLITMIIGIFIALDGLCVLIAALRYAGPYKLLHIIGAALYLLLGVVSIIAPMLVNVFWVIMIGFWELLSGIQSFFFAGKLRRMSLFSGIFSVLCGVLLISAPLTGILAISWLIGAALLLNGLLAIVFGLRMRLAALQ